MKPSLLKTIVLLLALALQPVLYAQKDSTQLKAPELWTASCVIPIVFEGDSGIFVMTPCDTRIRYELEYGSLLTNENIALQGSVWTRDIVIDHFRDKYRAEQKVVEALRNERSLLHADRKQDRAVIEGLVEQMNRDERTIRRQRVTIAGLGISCTLLAILAVL